MGNGDDVARALQEQEKILIRVGDLEGVLEVPAKKERVRPLGPFVVIARQEDGLLRLFDAEIAVTGGKTAAPTTLSFRVLDPAGSPVADLEPYLGAMGHLVLISGDGKEYVHVHPLAKPAVAGTVGFEAHFNKPGLYKGWGQFQRKGKVHHVPFVLRIE